MLCFEVWVFFGMLFKLRTVVTSEVRKIFKGMGYAGTYSWANYLTACVLLFFVDKKYARSICCFGKCFCYFLTYSDFIE